MSDATLSTSRNMDVCSLQQRTRARALEMGKIPLLSTVSSHSFAPRWPGGPTVLSPSFGFQPRSGDDTSGNWKRCKAAVIGTAQWSAPNEPRH